MIRKNSEIWRGFLPPRAIVMVRKAMTNPSVSQPNVDVSPGLLTKGIPTFQKPPEELSQITQTLTTELHGCARCKLCSGRKTIVVGEGHERAQLMFVGEGPGEQEDLQGRPFVGPAGQLLDRMIGAIGLQRRDVYIANIVKCRPPGNRNPEPDEIQACSPFIMRQLDAIQPKVVVALGNVAVKTLLRTEQGITRLRGQSFPFRNGSQLIPTFHPSYLLRNPPAKKQAWEDLQKVAHTLGLSLPPIKRAVNE